VAVFDEGRVAVTQGGGDSAGSPQEYTLEKNTELSFGPDQKRIHAVPVSRMARYRGAVVLMRTRVNALRTWKPRSAERRAALRDRALKRKIVRRQLRTSADEEEGVPAARPAAQGAVRAAAAKRAKAKAAAARRAKARRKARQAQEDNGGEEGTGQ
jgi:hypothetical protein